MSVATFCHRAFIYADDGRYVDGLVPFVREGVAAGERVLVAVEPRKIDLLRDALDSDGQGVEFADMLDVGRNPAQIIPMWQDLVDRAATEGRGVRGIGEPIHGHRSDDELAECAQHEALLNIAFADGPGWSLVCPYDAKHLTPAAIAVAYHTHPDVNHPLGEFPSDRYEMPSHSGCLAHLPLSAPPQKFHEFPFDIDRLRDARRFVADAAGEAGLDVERVRDLVTATSEVVTNSVRHGGGSGTLRFWLDAEAVVCEVSDEGVIDDPLAGRRRPTKAHVGGYGLWLTNSLCDLVQLRSDHRGTVVRMHMRF
jgi:anti-sigma regulatory factor (Ser/Thr protein kinase)